MERLARVYWKSNDKHTETKAQKPNPMMIDKSQARMSTISRPLLGLASAAASDSTRNVGAPVIAEQRGRGNIAYRIGGSG
jgi:hypothetical protein